MKRSYSSPKTVSQVESSESELKRREEEKSQKYDKVKNLADEAGVKMESGDLDDAEKAIMEAEKLLKPAPEIMSEERMEQIKHSSQEDMDEIEAEKELQKNMIYIYHRGLGAYGWVPKPGSHVEYVPSKQFPEFREKLGELVIPAKIESVEDGRITIRTHDFLQRGKVALRIEDVDPRLIKMSGARDFRSVHELHENLDEFLQIVKQRGGGKKKSKGKSKRKKSKEKSKRKKSKGKSKRKKSTRKSKKR